MHELGIAMQIIDAVSERAQGARVTKVVVQIGMLAAVLPDALSFCFELAAQGTAAEGATLEILHEPGRARCRSCSRELQLTRPFGRCICGGSDLDWLSGEQLQVFEMEVA